VSVVLHEGHGQEGTAAAGGLSPGPMALIAVGVLVFLAVIVSSYALKRYAGS
jgi:hypothetical protein